MERSKGAQEAGCGVLVWHARGWDLAALWVVVCGGDTNDDGRGGDGDGVVIGLWKNTQG
jgi:hypothetical protein